MHSSSCNPLPEHLLSLAMANPRSPSAEYQAAVTMRGELDEIYAYMSAIRRDMSNLRDMWDAAWRYELLVLHERLDDTVSSIQALTHVCFAHARATEGIIRSRPAEWPPYERRPRSPPDRSRSRSRSLNRQRLHTDP